jgi:hypothetical protein
MEGPDVLRWQHFLIGQKLLESAADGLSAPSPKGRPGSSTSHSRRGCGRQGAASSRVEGPRAELIAVWGAALVK